MKIKREKLVIFFSFMYIGIFLTSFIDRLFISLDKKIGFQALFSLGMILPLILFLICISMIIFSGIKLVPEKISDDIFQYKKVAGNMIFLSMVMALVSTVLMESINTKIGYFGASYNMLEVLRSYMPFYCINMIFVVINLVLQIIFVTYGDFKRYLFSFVFNFGLRVLFEFLFIGLAQLSMLGLFLAVLLSNMMTLGVLIPKFIFKKHDYKLCVKDLKPDFHVILSILKNSLSTFVISISISIVLTLFTINLKNYHYDLMLEKVNILYFILSAIIFLISGSIMGSHITASVQGIYKKKLFVYQVVIVIFCILLSVIGYGILKWNLLDLTSIAPEILDVVRALLKEYITKLVVIIIIAIANIIYMIGVGKHTMMWNIVKIAVSICPMLLIIQPFCLATGIGYSAAVTDFFNGNSFDSYEYFGSHLVNQNGEKGCMFRVYAPNAANVTLVYSANEDETWQQLEMNVDENGIYSLFVPGIKEGDKYEYKITTNRGKNQYKVDPYCYQMSLTDHTYSIVKELDEYEFSDEEWMNQRSNRLDKPMSVYELHLGSWKKKKDGAYYNYTELKNELIPYLKERGYNYVEFLPLSETVLYESWGYLPTAYYSVTSRYGSIEQLKDFINELHKNNIGVLFDFIGYHYMNQEDGLVNFDGTELYGFEEEQLAGTAYSSLKMNYNKNIVRSFLFSNMNYWFEEFHFDGVRVDAVCETMYWDREEQENLRSSGAKFIKDLNSGIRYLHPNVYCIAEDASSQSKISTEVDQGGMGFDFKWDMGWSYDTLEFLSEDQQYRKENYHNISFSMMYFFDVKSMITITHDDANPSSQEGIYGNVIERMYGSKEDQLRQGRLLYTYMFTHPGKKLMFMGSEFAQYEEWDCTTQLDWELLENEDNVKFLKCIDELNQLYASNEVLYKDEYDASKFSWMDVTQQEKLVYVYERSYKEKQIIVALNFSDNDYDDFKIPYSKDAKLREIFNSDDVKFGGDTVRNSNFVEAVNANFKYEFSVKLPKFSGVVYEVIKEY